MRRCGDAGRCKAPAWPRTSRRPRTWQHDLTASAEADQEPSPQVDLWSIPGCLGRGGAFGQQPGRAGAACDLGVATTSASAARGPQQRPRDFCTRSTGGACGVILSGSENSEGELRCPRLWPVLTCGAPHWQTAAARTVLPASSATVHPPSSRTGRGYLNLQSPPTAGAALREREARHWRSWLRPVVGPHLLAASSSGYPVRAG